MRLSDIDIFKFNHDLRFAYHRVFLHNKLFPTIILTSNHNIHSLIYIGQEVQTMCSD